MIKTHNLEKKYGTFTAVKNLSLNIPQGQIYGFLGPNGSGKTTTIMMLLGIIRPTKGEIYLFEEQFRPERLDLRKRIGMVPEKHPFGMWPWITGYEYLKLFADLFEIDSEGNGAEKRILYLLEQVGLRDVKNKKIHEYSRGMMQKLSIVRALLHDPDILFLDEPISGLDPLGVKQVRDLILEENREGRTIFISSHLLSEVEKICRRVAIMYNGTLRVEDEMGAILSTLAGGREIRVDLEQLPPDIPERMKELSFVQNATIEEDSLLVKVPKEGDYRKDISSFLIAQNLVPLGIAERTMSLEEAFVTITKENIDMFTAIGEKQ